MAGKRDAREAGPSVIVDTNVVLDVVLAREPWVADSSRLLDRAASGAVRAFVAPHTLPTVYYLVHRARGRAVAVRAVSDVLSIADVVELGSSDFQRALTIEITDFEDAVQAAAALRIGADYLVTRNAKDFARAGVSARSPAEVLALLPIEDGS